MEQLTQTEERTESDGALASNNQTTREPIQIACDWTAIPTDQRATHQALVHHLLFELAKETVELADGYAFRFNPNDYREAAGFIENERLCCPFFAFGLEVTPAGGPIWLRLTGDEQVKEFVSAILKG